MATYIDLNTEARETGRKGPARRLRAQGKLPAVVYGHGDNVSISFELKEFERAVGASEDGYRSLVRLQGASEGDTVMVKDIVRDPVTEHLIHVDFYRVDMNEKIKLSVPMRTQGVARGVKAGGVLSLKVRELPITCLPGDLPHALMLDVTNMKIDQVMKVKDLVAIEGVEVLADPNLVVAGIKAPRVAKGKGGAAVIDDEPEEEVTEPELIGKGKEEEEGE